MVSYDPAQDWEVDDATVVVARRAEEKIQDRAWRLGYDQGLADGKAAAPDKPAARQTTRRPALSHRARGAVTAFARRRPLVTAVVVTGALLVLLATFSTTAANYAVLYWFLVAAVVAIKYRARCHSRRRRRRW